MVVALLNASCLKLSNKSKQLAIKDINDLCICTDLIQRNAVLDEPFQQLQMSQENEEAKIFHFSGKQSP
jgi:hypothetical protein